MKDPVAIFSRPSKAANNAEKARIEQMEKDAIRRAYEHEDRARVPWVSKPVPLLLRALGVRWWQNKWLDCHRTPWGEIAIGRSPKLAIDLYCYEDAAIQIGLLFITLYIKLPFLTRWMDRGPNAMENRGYGFVWYLFNRDGLGLHLHWGYRTKILDMPWGWNMRKGDYRSEKLTRDGQWIESREYDRLTGRDAPKTVLHGTNIEVLSGDEAPPLWSKTYPFKHLSRGGEFQMANVTVTRSRRFDVYRIFWIATRRREQHHIDMAFDREMGDERGSWKGGTVGCSAKMRPGETPREALHRFQCEAKFR